MYDSTMANLALSCVYGSTHTPFVYTFIHSVLESCSEIKIIIGYSDFSEVELKLLQIAYPQVTFVNLELSGEVTSTRAARASKKTKLWCQLLESHVSYGDNSVFLDIDTIMLQSPFEVFAGKEDLAITRKLGKWPLNTGVIFVKKSDSTVDLFHRWNSSTETIFASRNLNRKAEISSGGADQYSLNELLKISGLIRDLSIDSTYNEELNLWIKFLPCSQYNETESVPLEKGTKIVHFKAGWHKILLQSSPYTKNRPEHSSSEMYELWEATYFKANMLLYENLNLMAWADKTLIQNVRAIDYEFRGIYNSELVLITSLFKSLNITKILELGRARGHSTYVIAKILQSNENFLLFSIDFKRDEASLYAEERLKSLNSVELLYGDSNLMLRKISHDKRIQDGESYGVVLDGPKGLNAMFLSIKLMRSKRSPKIIFIHDMRKFEKGKPSFHRYVCSIIFDRVFFSDEFKITPEVLATDTSVFNFIEPDEEYPIKPYHKGYYNTGSYGPTLAVIIPSQRDTRILGRFLPMPFNRMIFFFKQLTRFQVSSLIRKFKF